MTIRNMLSKLILVVTHPQGMAGRFRFAFPAFLFILFFSPVSDAQIHTFVSALGNDISNCSRTAPCRTLAHAISVTSAGGDVVVLGSAVF
jgi:hypothetical protein